MGVTTGNQRSFVCRKCGKAAVEGLYRWRRKPQKLKNVCFECIRRAETARLDAQERREYPSFPY